MNGINGKETSLSAASLASRRNSSRRQTHDATDEEEIDDDEENALSNLRNVRNGSTDMQTPPVPTEDVISLLLQRQTPVLNKPKDERDSSEKEQQEAAHN